jgi:hypothetical protein
MLDLDLNPEPDPKPKPVPLRQKVAVPGYLSFFRSNQFLY